MVRPCDYLNVDVVDAKTMESFLEYHSHDGHTYIRAKVGQEYFVRMTLSRKIKQPIIVELCIDGKHIGSYIFYNEPWYRCFRKSPTLLAGVEDNGKECALRFVEPNLVLKPNCYMLQQVPQSMGQIEVRVASVKIGEKQDITSTQSESLLTAAVQHKKETEALRSKKGSILAKHKKTYCDRKISPGDDWKRGELSEL